MNKEEYSIIDEIVNRAYEELHINQSRLSTLMDIENTHNINPLRLTELLNANKFEFAHDVYGIINNFNRKTMQLDNCFLPRFSF